MPNRTQKLAQMGIVVQFAALIRCLGEYFRLKYFVVDKFSIVHIEPFIVGAAVTAILAFCGDSFLFCREVSADRDRIGNQRGNPVCSAIYAALSATNSS